MSDSADSAPQKSFFWAAYVAWLGAISFGCPLGIIAGILLEPRWKFVLPPREFDGEVDLFATSLVFGALFGSLLVSPLTNTFGRKWIVVCAAAWECIFGIVLCFMKTTIPSVIIRALSGVGVGIILGICPSYGFDVAPGPKIGIVLGYVQAFIVTGITIANIINLIFCNVNEAWQYEFGLSYIPAALLGVSMIFAPESPSFAGKLRRFTHSKEYKEEHKDQPQGESMGSIFVRMYKKYPMGFIVSFVLAAFFHLTGLNVIIFFQGQILASAGLERIPILGVNIAIGAWNVIWAAIPNFFIGRFGRKPILIVMTIPQIIGLILLAVGFQLSTDVPYGGVKHGATIPLSIVGMLFFIAGFNCGIGPIFYVITNEILPYCVSPVTSVIAQTIQWLSNIVICMINTTMLATIDDYGWYYMLAGIAVLQLLFCFWPLYETKGILLEENIAPAEEKPAEKEMKNIDETDSTTSLGVGNSSEQIHSEESSENAVPVAQEHAEPESADRSEPAEPIAQTSSHDSHHSEKQD